MALGGTYSTGTASVSAAGTSVVGNGTGWLLNEILEGDTFYSNGAFMFVGADATSNTALTLMDAWPGADVTDGDYIILKTSWKRYDPALTQAKTRELLALLDTVGLIYYVEGSEPDPAVGENEQWALKTNSGAWKIWQKIDGVWVLQGSPSTVTPRGIWDPATLFVANDLVSRNGSLYAAIQPSQNKDPAVEPTYWAFLAAGGTRHEIGIWAVGQPLASEELFRFIMSTTVAFPTNFAGSVAKIAVAATSAATFTLKKNGSSIGTITFGSGQSVGTFSGSAATFAANDILSVTAPAIPDATLANLSINLVGSR